MKKKKKKKISVLARKKIFFLKKYVKTVDRSSLQNSHKYNRQRTRNDRASKLRQLVRAGHSDVENGRFFVFRNNGNMRFLCIDGWIADTHELIVIFFSLFFFSLLPDAICLASRRSWPHPVARQRLRAWPHRSQTTPLHQKRNDAVVYLDTATAIFLPRKLDVVEWRHVVRNGHRRLTKGQTLVDHFKHLKNGVKHGKDGRLVTWNSPSS